MMPAMRPEILFPLFASVSTLKGVGPKVEPLVQRLAGPLVRDMLFLGPQALVHRTPTTVDSVVDGQVHTLNVEVELHSKPPRMDIPWKIRTFDGKGKTYTVRGMVAIDEEGDLALLEIEMPRCCSSAMSCSAFACSACIAGSGGCSCGCWSFCKICRAIASISPSSGRAALKPDAPNFSIDNMSGMVSGMACTIGTACDQN